MEVGNDLAGGRLVVKVEKSSSVRDMSLNEAERMRKWSGSHESLVKTRSSRERVGKDEEMRAMARGAWRGMSGRNVCVFECLHLELS